MSSILKHSMFLIWAQGFAKAVSFIYTIYLARILGVDNFGLYSVALTYFALVASISDLGFSRFLIREGAKNTEAISRYLSNIFILRFLISFTLVLGFGLGLVIFDNNNYRIGLSVLGLIAVLPQALSLSLDGVMVATQKIKYSAICLVVLSVITTLTGGYLVLNHGSFGAIVGLILGQLIYLAALIICFKNLAIKLTRPMTSEWLSVIKGTTPYAFIGIIGLIYFRIDTLLLSYLSNETSVGIYAAGFRFLEGLVFIPSAVATVLFPVLAKIDDPARIKIIYKKATKALFLLSIPITLIFVLVLPELIKRILPEYLASIVVIQILAISIPFMFVHIPGSLILISHQKYLKSVMIATVLMLMFNLTTNLMFIPRYSYIASSIITSLSEILSFFVFFGLLWWKILRK